jgi:hypothetical protein
MSRAHDAAARTLRGAITDMKTLGKLHPVAPSIREHIPGELSPARQLQEISRETPAPTHDAP